MRTLACLLTMLVVTPTFAAICFFARLFGVPFRPGGLYERLIRSWARAVVRAAGMRLHVDTGGLDLTGPCIYIANHTSWFDIMALAVALPRFTFIAKKELARWPIFGSGAKAAGIIFINRENRRSAYESYAVAAEQVRAGKNVIVYPEGTRGYDYGLRSFKKGPFVLAIAAGVPIVPCIVYGQMEILRKGSIHVHSGPVNVHLLEPVPTTGYTYEQRDELLRLVWHRMADALMELYGVQSPEGPLASDRAVPNPVSTSIS